jgi:nucleotide-binding universal stress UspA family protein
VPRFRPQAGFIVASTLFAAVFVALVLSAFHAPSPHGLPVGIVAPATVSTPVEQALDRAEPGGFAVRAYDGEAAARTAIARGELDGALIAAPGRLRLLVAQAAGAAPAQALTSAMSAAAAGSGVPLAVTDVAPPLAGDTMALSPFFVTLGVLIPSLAAGSASALAFRRSRPAWCVAAPVAVAVVLGAVAAGIADGLAGLGSYPAIAGIIALFSLAVAAPTAALGRIWPPLVAAPLLAFLVLGIPVSGGPSGLAAFAPGFLRVLHPALPLGAAASAVRSAVYFDGYGTAGPLWTLAAWAVAGVAALTLVTAWRWRAAGAAVAAATSARLETVGMPGRLSARAASASPETDDAPTRLPALTASVRQGAGGMPGGLLAVAGSGLPSGLAAPEADGREPVTPAGVVAGFDNSGPARRALGAAARLAPARHGALHVVYADHAVIDSDLSGFGYAEMEAARDQDAANAAKAAADIVAQAGIPYTFERRPGAPADAILDAAAALPAGEGDDPLIVVGRSGHAARHLLGSVPARLLHHSPYPVLTIP